MRCERVGCPEVERISIAEESLRKKEVGHFVGGGGGGGGRSTLILVGDGKGSSDIASTGANGAHQTDGTVRGATDECSDGNRQQGKDDNSHARDPAESGRGGVAAGDELGLEHTEAVYETYGGEKDCGAARDDAPAQ